jgi:ATP-dependent DNA helicase RecG
VERDEALELIAAVRSGRYEDAVVEVKAAHTGLPKRIHESLSAIANRATGGAIVLGLDEAHGYALVGVMDVQATLAQLADVAARMMPPVRLDSVVVEVEGRHIIVADVPECPFDLKPCFYEPAGTNAGSYIRVGNTNRRMTSYEIFSYVSNRSQPVDDREPVVGCIDDLDPGCLRDYVDSFREQRPALWDRLRLGDLPLERQLCELGVLTSVGEDLCPTLAALLCFGR